MKAIGVVGYHNSGKTTLSRALAQELSNRGYRVAAVKHASERFDSLGKDTAVLGEVANPVAFVSPDQSGVLWRGALGLEDLLSHIEADMVIVEGFKRRTTFPKIACLRGEPGDADLLDGQVICAIGPIAGELPIGVPLYQLESIDLIADLVEQEAVNLPAPPRQGPEPRTRSQSDPR